MVKVRKTGNGPLAEGIEQDRFLFSLSITLSNFQGFQRDTGIFEMVETPSSLPFKNRVIVPVTDGILDVLDSI